MWWKVRFQSPNSCGYGPRRTNGMKTKLTNNIEINKNVLFCAFTLLCVISSESGVNATFFRWLFSRPFDSTRHTGRSLGNDNGEPLERMSFYSRNTESSPNSNFYSNPLPLAEPEPTEVHLPEISPTERSRSMSIFSYLIRRLTRNRNFEDNQNHFLPSSSPFFQHQYPVRASFASGRKTTTSTESTYNSNSNTKSGYDSNSKQTTLNTFNPETNITRSTKSYFSNEEQNIIASTSTTTARKEDITYTNYLTDYKVDSANLSTFSLVDFGENANFENETHMSNENDTMVQPSKLSMNLLLPKTTEMSTEAETETGTSSNVLSNNMTSVSILDEYSAFENDQVDVLYSAGWNSSSDSISSALEAITPAPATTLPLIFKDNNTTVFTRDFIGSKEESTVASGPSSFNSTTASETQIPAVTLSPYHETSTDYDDYEVHDAEVDVTAKTTTKIPSGPVPVPVYDSDFSDSSINEDVIKVNPEETYIQQPIYTPNFEHDPNLTKPNDSLSFSSVSISIQVQNLSKSSTATQNELHGDSNNTDQTLEDIERSFLYKATAPTPTELNQMIPLLRPQPRLVNDDPDRKEKENQLHFPEDLTTLHKLLQHLVQTIGSVIPPRSQLSDGKEQDENGPIKPSFFNINIGTINLNTGQNSRIINNGYPPSFLDPTDSNGGNRNENNMQLQHRPADRHDVDGSSNQGQSGNDWLHSKSTSASSSSPRISYSLPPKNNSHGQFSVLILT